MPEDNPKRGPREKPIALGINFIGGVLRGLATEADNVAAQVGAPKLFRELADDAIVMTEQVADTLRSWAAGAATTAAAFLDPAREIKRDDVFLVHGHDDSLLDQVARAVAQWGLTPIILRDLPGGTLTIKEKLRKFAGRPHIGFVVVMLTEDDDCACAETQGKHKRARQNAIYELGYFMGAFGGDRCCVLIKGKPEEFSDIGGLSTTRVDDAGSWLERLRLELSEAGVPLR